MGRPADGREGRELEREVAEAQRLGGGEVLAVEREPHGGDADEALGRRGRDAAHRVVVAAEHGHSAAPRIGPRRAEAVDA